MKIIVIKNDHYFDSANQKKYSFSVLVYSL